MAIPEKLKKKKDKKETVKPKKAFVGDALDATLSTPPNPDEEENQDKESTNGASTSDQEPPVIPEVPTQNQEQQEEPPVVTSTAPKKKKAPKANDSATTRASFIINLNKLDKLKDFIYAKKVSGDFRYTQEQGLDEALDLLFATMKKIPPRPESERVLERQRSQQIKSGKKE